jgi:hypothetical protein
MICNASNPGILNIGSRFGLAYKGFQITVKRCGREFVGRRVRYGMVDKNDETRGFVVSHVPPRIERDIRYDIAQMGINPMKVAALRSALAAIPMLDCDPADPATLRETRESYVGGVKSEAFVVWVTLPKHILDAATSLGMVLTGVDFNYLFGEDGVDANGCSSFDNMHGHNAYNVGSSSTLGRFPAT